MNFPINQLLKNQFEAAFCTLDATVTACPASSWDAPVGNLAFCQVVFHTLFFSDYYLCAEPDELRGQQFHLDHAEFFRDYEELQPRRQQLLYGRPSVQAYLNHCRDKASCVLSEECIDALCKHCGFPPKPYSRAELHVYNIRHIQHHAAQLSLRLRLDHNVDIAWVGSGWNAG